MPNILKKEMKLSASIVTYVFMLFGLMFLLPGYPILCGVFFSTLGIYKSFEYANQANDIEFSLLLPISRKDVIKGKYIFVCMIESGTLFIMILSVLFRMTILKDASFYHTNPLMNANLFALGAACILFGLFNLTFLKGFFKTAYKTGKPFLIYIILCFLGICIFEAMHYFPGLERVNAFGMEDMALQVCLFGIGVVFYIIVSIYSYKKACKQFERIDI